MIATGILAIGIRRLCTKELSGFIFCYAVLDGLYVIYFNVFKTRFELNKKNIYIFYLFNVFIFLRNYRQIK